MLNTILGSFSSGVVAVPSSYESIATVTVGSGGSANVEFTSISSDYTHLQIRGIYKCTTANDDYVLLQFNSDTGSNYSRHRLRGNGSAVAAGAQTSQTSGIGGFWHPTFPTPDTNNFGVTIVDILDYKNTNKYTTIRILTGTDNNNVYTTLGLYSSLWMNTAAVTSIKLIAADASNFSQYTQFALYGIKGA